MYPALWLERRAPGHHAAAPFSSPSSGATVSILLEKLPKAKAEEAAKAKTENAPSPPAPDVATTSTVDRVNVAPGQPICVDRDALAAMLAAGVLASSPAEATTNGCQAIPEDAKVELLERYPSGLRFLRVIRVKVTSPAPPD